VAKRTPARRTPGSPKGPTAASRAPAPGPREPVHHRDGRTASSSEGTSGAGTTCTGPLLVSRSHVTSPIWTVTSCRSPPLGATVTEILSSCGSRGVARALRSDPDSRRSRAWTRRSCPVSSRRWDEIRHVRGAAPTVSPIPGQWEVIGHPERDRGTRLTEPRSHRPFGRRGAHGGPPLLLPNDPPRHQHSDAGGAATRRAPRRTGPCASPAHAPDDRRTRPTLESLRPWISSKSPTTIAV